MSERIDGDDEWLGRWVTTYGDRLARFLWTYTGDEEAAKDLTQEVFLRLYREHRLHPLRSLHGGWLYAVGRRLAIDRSRRERVARRASVSLYEEPSMSDEAERIDVEQLLDRLSARDREIVLLFYYQEWSSEEIARHYGCPAGTVRTRLLRARDKLRALWGG